MFVKKATSVNKNTKKKYVFYSLAEAIRTPKGPRHRTLLALGSDFDLPKNQHRLLARRVDEIISGEDLPIRDYPEAVEQLAQRCAARIIRSLSPEGDCVKTDYHTVDINTEELSDSRTIGAEHLALQMACQIGLDEKLDSLGFSKKDSAIALASILSRTVEPASERATLTWLRDRSGLGELLGIDFNEVSLDKLYRISDRLLAHKTEIERHLEMQEQRLHGYTSILVLYDLTNTYMEGRAAANPKAAYGVSKEKRKDCPLITMGLAVNEHGFLYKTSLLPGNVREPTTLQAMIKSLATHGNASSRPIVIFDAGIATEENLTWLRSEKYPYIVCSRRKNQAEVELEDVLTSVGDRHNLVKAAFTKTKEGDEEQWLYCESEAKAITASGMKKSFRKRFEDDLQKVAESLTKPKGRKKLPDILTRIGRLKEKHKCIAHCYEITVTPSEDGMIATAVTWEPIENKMDAALTGRYFLRAYAVTGGVAQLWQLYNVLHRAEDVFQFLKSSLGMRPVFHQKEHRVDGHLWITVLAYHVIHNCLYQLKQKGISCKWSTVRSTMMGRTRGTSQMKTIDGRMLHHRITERADEKQKEIYQVLGLPSSILRPQKTLI